MLFTSGGSGYIEPDAVYDWFELCVSAIDAHRAEFERWFRSGQVGHPPTPLPSALVGARLEDVRSSTSLTCFRSRRRRRISAR